MSANSTVTCRRWLAIAPWATCLAASRWDLSWERLIAGQGPILQSSIATFGPSIATILRQHDSRDEKMHTMSRSKFSGLLRKTGPVILLVMTLTSGLAGSTGSEVRGFATYQSNPHRLVLGLRPGRSIRGEIEYVRSWSPNYAIAIVTAREQPKCQSRTWLTNNRIPYDTVSCSVPIQFSEMIDGHSDDRVRIYYWYHDESEIVSISPNSRILALLAPAKDGTTYVCTLMMRATEENIETLRSALREIDG